MSIDKKKVHSETILEFKIKIFQTSLTFGLYESFPLIVLCTTFNLELVKGSS